MSAYAELCRLAREWSALGAAASLLGWDQETYMPHAAAPFRAEQQAVLAALVHQKSTHPRVGELIAACEADPNLTGDPASPAAANIREFRRDYDLAVKLPEDLVAEIAKVSSQSQEVWKEARAKSDFPMFAPWLEKVLNLTRRKAECLGAPPGGELYDALLDEYEPGATAKEIEAIFTPLRARLAALIARVMDVGTPPNLAPLSIKADPHRQHDLGQFILKAIGFDLSSGRLDVTTHPFCSGMAPGDTRLTTRYRDERFTDALYGTLHEAGHGLYEQGLPKLGAEPLFGQPLSQAVSLGIHESQSRLWENFVGRSREFWQWAMPFARLAFAPALDTCTPNDMFRAVNTASPSLIRVEADEATYNLHVMVRFEIERALISGKLAVKDLPEAWNAKYKALLGIDVPDDRRGCLQDVHWSFGLIGYFPTYTLGNLYAAQMWHAIAKAMPDTPTRIARGEFAPLLQWLRDNVHAHGRRYRAADLCVRATGAPLSADHLIAHLESRILPVYGL